MTNEIVIFDSVQKSYPSYYHLTGGIKSFLFHLPSAIRELRSRRIVLDNVSLTIHRGETFGFIGKNGAGKSTLLGLIAGVLRPEKGRVITQGRVSPLLELGAGFHPELTGRENILLNGVLLGLRKEEVHRHFDEIVEFSGLEEFIDQPIRTYSSGMFAKLGFSVVAHLKPEILLVDEILSVGDIAFAQKCEKRIEELRKNKNVTIILVSHTMASVGKICDRAAWIDSGHVRMLGDAKQVVDSYQQYMLGE